MGGRILRGFRMGSWLCDGTVGFTGTCLRTKGPKHDGSTFD